MRVRDLAQEAWEMGLSSFAYRVAWESMGLFDAVPEVLDGLRTKNAPYTPSPQWAQHLPFHDARSVAEVSARHISEASRASLLKRALEAGEGVIYGFSASPIAYGKPIDWHLQPDSQRRWPARVHWRRSLAEAAQIGDVKLIWEPARFPQAYHMARAAAFFPGLQPALANVLAAQIRQFTAANPRYLGVHWSSGQEVAVRMLAWLFATRTLLPHSADFQDMQRLVGEALHASAAHVYRHLGYARRVVRNNHLIAEGLLLLAASVLLTDCAESPKWLNTALDVLHDAARSQIYADGSYINQSHTYHRVVLQYFVWAILLLRAGGRTTPRAWLDAMDRSLSFLVAHQCPKTGVLPNFGANDGALPSILDTCEYSDFRPILQLVSVLVREERIYDRGPWDEGVAWCAGPLALDTPLRAPVYRSRSFTETGHHVLRGTDPNTFLTFRCGTVRERFTQADQLHVDLWVDGHNVLVDGGTYLYNGPQRLHEHFVGAGSHNTLTVDGHSQMVHFRKFKHIYLTSARRKCFEDSGRTALVSGEHDGFLKPTGCRHRRSVLFVKDNAWVIVDTVTGKGRHKARLHWLAAASKYINDSARGCLTLDTPAGPLHVAVYDGAARPLIGTVVVGQEDEPRGWYSRHYNTKVAVPSFAVEVDAECPITFITVMQRTATSLAYNSGVYSLGDEHGTAFRVKRGTIQAVGDDPQ